MCPEITGFNITIQKTGANACLYEKFWTRHVRFVLCPQITQTPLGRNVEKTDETGFPLHIRQIKHLARRICKVSDSFLNHPSNRIWHRLPLLILFEKILQYHSSGKLRIQWHTEFSFVVYLQNPLNCQNAQKQRKYLRKVKGLSDSQTESEEAPERDEAEWGGGTEREGGRRE